MDVPEKADVLVSEIIGNEAFAEDVLSVVADAWKRFLKPEAIIVPSRIKVYGQAVQIPPKMLERRVLTNDKLAEWQKWYGIDFSALATLNSKEQIKFNLKHTEAAELTTVGDPFLFADISLENFKGETINADIPAIKTADFNGIMQYFELTLGDQLLTNNPRDTTKTNHWAVPVFYTPAALELKTGSVFRFEYSLAANKHSQIKIIADKH